MPMCSPQMEKTLNGVGSALDCTERFLRMAQGFLLITTASIHPSSSWGRSMHLHKFLSGASFGRDFINALYTVRDVWALQESKKTTTPSQQLIYTNGQGNKKSTPLLERVIYADGWVMDVSTTLMFFQDWTPLKFGAFAPLIEKICNASWVSYCALTTLKQATEDKDPLKKIDFYKSLGDLSFAATSVWLPGMPRGITAVASGALGLRVLLSQKS